MFFFQFWCCRGICRFHAFLTSRWCRGEKKLVLVTLFAVNSPYLCRDCRYIRDAIRRLAIAQDCLAWYDQVFSSDEQTFVVCESYRLHRKNLKKHAGALRSYPILEIKHTMLKESGTDYAAEGEMMNKRRWVVWSTESLFLLV